MGITTHKLRHTAATLMYQHGGVDTLVLKDILGHKSIATTEIYTHLSDENIKKYESNPLSEEIEKKRSKQKPCEENHMAFLLFFIRIIECSGNVRSDLIDIFIAA